MCTLGMPALNTTCTIAQLSSLAESLLRYTCVSVSAGNNTCVLRSRGSERLTNLGAEASVCGALGPALLSLSCVRLPVQQSVDTATAFVVRKYVFDHDIVTAAYADTVALAFVTKPLAVTTRLVLYQGLLYQRFVFYR